MSPNFVHHTIHWVFIVIEADDFVVELLLSHGLVSDEQVEQAREKAAQERGALLRAVTETSGTADGAAQSQIDVLYEHFDDAGLQPDVDESTLTFALAPCNYHDAIDQDQSLVCAVHARLVGDVLRQVEGPLALKRLDPFLTPHSCRVQLTRRRNAAAEATPEEA